MKNFWKNTDLSIAGMGVLLALFAGIAIGAADFFAAVTFSVMAYLCNLAAVRVAKVQLRAKKERAQKNAQILKENQEKSGKGGYYLTFHG